MVQTGQGLGHDEHAHARGHQFDRVRRRGGPLDRGLARQLLPDEGVVEGMPHDLVGEVLGGDLLGRRHEVVLRDDDHRGLGVEGDRTEIRTVDREPDEPRVGVTGAQYAEHLGGGDLGEGQRDVGQPLVPDPYPLGRGHAGDISEPERMGYFRACHPARLPGVVGTRAHARYP